MPPINEAMTATPKVYAGGSGPVSSAASSRTAVPSDAGALVLAGGASATYLNINDGVFQIGDQLWIACTVVSKTVGFNFNGTERLETGGIQVNSAGGRANLVSVKKATATTWQLMQNT